MADTSLQVCWFSKTSTWSVVEMEGRLFCGICWCTRRIKQQRTRASTSSLQIQQLISARYAGTWKKPGRDLSVRPDQLYLYKMRDKNGKLTLMLEREQIWRIASASGNRRSTAIPWWTAWIWWRHTVRKYKKHRQIHWTSNFWRSTRSQYFSKKINCEDQQGDTTLEVILEDLWADLDMT